MPTSIIASDKSVKSLPQTSLNQSEMNGDYSNEQVDERQLAVSTNTTVENEREPLINVPESKRNIGGRYSSNECVNREAHDNDNPALAVAHNIQDKLYLSLIHI